MTMTRPPQLSTETSSPVKLGTVATQAAPRAILRLVGHCKITGGSRSSTVTVKAHAFVFPLLSRAVQVTMVRPFGNWAGALFETVTDPQLSLITGVPSARLVA